MNGKEWQMNIEIIADSISQAMGTPEVVKSVLAYYGARSIDGLSPSCYADVFSDLVQIEADMS